MIAVPTTAGTGSEVTRSSVVNDTARADQGVAARLADRAKICDRRSGTYSRLPPPLTASTGMDALTHAIEAYTCNRATPISDALALHAIRSIAPIRGRGRDGSNTKAREAMMLASTIAGMAFSNADVAAVHCIAEALGGRYDTPHGIANSLFLPYLFTFDAQADPRRHAAVAVAMGAASGGDEPRALPKRPPRRWWTWAGPSEFPLKRDPGMEQDDFPWIASASEANLSNASNARSMTDADYLVILEHAWNTWRFTSQGISVSSAAQIPGVTLIPPCRVNGHGSATTPLSFRPAWRNLSFEAARTHIGNPSCYSVLRNASNAQCSVSTATPRSS